VTFTSAPAVHNLVALAGEAGLEAELLDAFNQGGVVAACVGPVCAEAARRAGVERPIAPPRGRLGLLVRTVSDALQSQRHALSMAGRRVVVQGHALSIDDEPVHLPGQEEAVFRTLLNRRGAVVSKSGLLRSLGTGVSAHALETTIARLRRRMGPAGQAIRSVPRRGYLLDADVGDPISR
jgi:uroporphyrinogen-III synthase